LSREALREIKELSHTSDLSDKMVSPVPGMSNADVEIKTETLCDKERRSRQSLYSYGSRHLASAPRALCPQIIVFY
jgi:hypothetical protein